jgi:hypothetical protein
VSAKCHVWGCPAYFFLDNHGVYTTIDPPGSHLSEPISINAKGQIVGVYRELGEPGDDRT